MAIKSRANLISAFQDGDVPTGSDYTDIFDSFLHLSDSSAQSVTSPITFNGAISLAQGLSIAGIVSGAGAGFTSVQASQMSAAAVTYNTLSGGTISATDVTYNLASGQSLVLGSGMTVNFPTTAQASGGTVTSAPGTNVPTTVQAYIPITVNGQSLLIPAFAPK